MLTPMKAPAMFHAILLEKPQADGPATASVQSVSPDRLPRTSQGDVHVQVAYSTINFKDGLAITGGAGRAAVVRQFPMVPGIDFAGRVISSDDPDFKAGD